MKQSILDYIRSHPTTTFANLDKAIPGFAGEMAMFNSEFPNIILWPAISQEALTSLGELLNEKAIVMRTASQLSYFIDGKRPTLPVASGVKAYKSERWLPVCFSTNESHTSKAA